MVISCLGHPPEDLYVAPNVARVGLFRRHCDRGSMFFCIQTDRQSQRFPQPVGDVWADRSNHIHAHQITSMHIRSHPCTSDHICAHQITLDWGPPQALCFAAFLTSFFLPGVGKSINSVSTGVLCRVVSISTNRLWTEPRIRVLQSKSSRADEPTDERTNERTNDWTWHNMT